MGLSATQAASNTHNQVVAAGLSATIGVTPMIGINDVQSEIFQLSDAQMLLNFANANSYITRLSMWSVSRDNGSCPNQGFASPVCSGIAQSNWAFSNILGQFRYRVRELSLPIAFAGSRRPAVAPASVVLIKFLKEGLRARRSHRGGEYGNH